MQRLNIPFGTTKTVRHCRRTVWNRVALTLIFVFIVWCVWNTWFSRDTLSYFSPEGTIAILDLTLSNKQWQNILRDFGDIPVITNHHLTMKDVARFAKGEIAIYLLENGTTALGIRSNMATIPFPMLDSYGIITKEVDNGKYILSDNELVLPEKAKIKWKIFDKRPSILGHITLIEDNKRFRGNIRGTKNGYKLDIPKMHAQKLDIRNFNQFVFAASTLPKGQTTQQVQLIINRVNSLLLPLDLPYGAKLVNAIEKMGGTIIFALNEAGGEADMIFQVPVTDNEIQIPDLLRSITAFHSPLLKDMELSDGTLGEEIVIDPATIEIEEVIMNGNKIYEAHTPISDFFASDISNKISIATNEDLLKSMLELAQNDEYQICSKNAVAFMRPNNFSQFLIQNYNSNRRGFIQNLNNFKEISINSGLLSDYILICK